MTRESAIKWAKEIKAFQEGKEIQMLWNDGKWRDNENPEFAINCEYRIKPANKSDIILDILNENAPKCMYLGDFMKLVKKTVDEVCGDE